MNSAMTSPKLDTLLSHAGLLGDESVSKREDLQNRSLEGSYSNLITFFTYSKKYLYLSV
jgi:hypothetical protein